MARQRDSSDHLDQARDLRRNMPSPERVLWQVLRNRKLLGLKFRRQFSIGPYLVDFACVEKHLVIEIDGDSHMGRFAHDQLREAEIRAAGWQVIRVTNDDVLKNLSGVLTLIVTTLGFDGRRWLDGEYGQLPEGLV
ncbi:MAG: DUF559 domain-containing protein [Planctomycetaceae bacterium]